MFLVEQYPFDVISVATFPSRFFPLHDPSATFMRIKKDYMGNDQLLPAYNVQFGIADEYIAVADVSQ